MQRAWVCLFAITFGAIVVAGCGRVDLEDLTPEAFKTQAAATATARANLPTSPAGGSPGAGGGGGETSGDLAAGSSLYNFWCTGCHDTGRQNAPPINGKQFQLDAVLPLLRGTSGKQHPAYKDFELTDKDFQNILAFLANS
jgi:mono/diheme cytochrome c family protein